MADRKHGSATGRISSGLGAVSDRLKKAATLDADRARSAFGTKLIAFGLAMVFLAGGLDYMERADRMREALTGIARDAGQTGLANAVEDVEHGVDRLKQSAFRSLPYWLQGALPYLGLVIGLGAVGGGLAVKLRVPGTSKGRILRDVGRVLTAPGLVGIFAISLLTWRAAPVLHVNASEFLRKLDSGELSSAAVWELTKSYGPRAWPELGGFLVVGLALIALSLAALALRGRWEGRKGFLFGLARRSAIWLGSLCIAYYVVATAASVVSYGGALRVVALPWQLDPQANIVTMLFLSGGLGLARSGTALMKREAADDGGE
jgi:hypothetical protein